MIGVIARLVVQEGQQDEFEGAMAELMAEVRAAEPGNLLYQVFKKRGSSTEYVVLERYTDQAALDAHGKAPHFQRMLPRLAPTLAGPLDIEVLDQVGAS